MLQRNRPTWRAVSLINQSSMFQRVCHFSKAQPNPELLLDANRPTDNVIVTLL